MNTTRGILQTPSPDASSNDARYRYAGGGHVAVVVDLPDGPAARGVVSAGDYRAALLER